MEGGVFSEVVELFGENGDCRLPVCTERPMSSAKARVVDVAGREETSLSRRMSMLRTKRVGDMGQP